MRRRQILAALPLSGGVLLGGCLQENTGTTEPGNETRTSTTRARTRTTVDGYTVKMQIRNHLSREITVEVAVASNGATLTETERTIQANGDKSVDTGIAEPGVYEIKVITESDRDTSTFSVEEYTVENERDFVVEISEDAVRTVLQE